MITALVALGPNEVQQICMLFDDMEQGKAYVSQHLGGKAKTYPRNYLGRNGIWIRPNKELMEIFDSGGTDIPEIAAFWTQYYGGCGGCGPLFLAEFPTATPILRWDLD